MFKRYKPKHAVPKKKMRERMMARIRNNVFVDAFITEWNNSENNNVTVDDFITECNNDFVDDFITEWNKSENTAKAS